MNNNDERDYAEEEYNRNFCPACGTSPCNWDGLPDGFHTGGYPEGYDYCGCCGGDADKPPKGEHDECCRYIHELMNTEESEKT